MWGRAWTVIRMLGRVRHELGFARYEGSDPESRTEVADFALPGIRII